MSTQIIPVTKSLVPATLLPIVELSAPAESKMEIDESTSSNGLILGEWITEKISGHSSGIVEIDPGRVCVVFNGRNQAVEGKEKKGIWLTVFDKESQKWILPLQIAKTDRLHDDPESDCTSPVICSLPPRKNAPLGELLIFFRVGPTYMTNEMRSYSAST